MAANPTSYTDMPSKSLIWKGFLRDLSSYFLFLKKIIESDPPLLIKAKTMSMLNEYQIFLI